MGALLHLVKKVPVELTPAANVTKFLADLTKEALEGRLIGVALAMQTADGSVNTGWAVDNGADKRLLLGALTACAHRLCWTLETCAGNPNGAA